MSDRIEYLSIKFNANRDNRICVFIGGDLLHPQNYYVYKKEVKLDFRRRQDEHSQPICRTEITSEGVGIVTLWKYGEIDSFDCDPANDYEKFIVQDNKGNDIVSFTSDNRFMWLPSFTIDFQRNKLTIYNTSYRTNANVGIWKGEINNHYLQNGI